MKFRVMVALLAMTGASSALEPSVEDGKELYMGYCVQCHGLEAKGDGPMAELIAIDTPDLTALAKNNEGVFPTLAVAQQIDGRISMLAHGGEMPIFGPFLDSEQNVELQLLDGQSMTASLPLANLLEYLKSAQID